MARSPTAAQGRARQDRRASCTRPASARCGASRSSHAERVSAGLGHRRIPRPETIRRVQSPSPTASARRRRNCSTATSASRSTRVIHHFYDQLCPPCAEFNFAQAHRARRPARPRGAAHRRPREDRLSGRPQAAALRARTLIVTTRFPRDSAPRYARGARLRRVGASARDLRPRPAAHAERRGVLPRAARHARPARLHRQQRLPDGAASARVLRAHDGGGERRRWHDMPAARARSCSARYEGLRGYHLLPEGGRRGRRRSTRRACRRSPG